jgi:hypothetical protein
VKSICLNLVLKTEVEEPAQSALKRGDHRCHRWAAGNLYSSMRRQFVVDIGACRSWSFERTLMLSTAARCKPLAAYPDWLQPWSRWRHL